MKTKFKEEKNATKLADGGEEANKTNADRITAGPAAGTGIMLRGAEVPQVTPPQNILLAAKSCPRISCLTTLATTTLPTFNVPSRVWHFFAHHLQCRGCRSDPQDASSLDQYRRPATDQNGPYHQPARTTTKLGRVQVASGIHRAIKKIKTIQRLHAEGLHPPVQSMIN